MGTIKQKIISLKTVKVVSSNMQEGQKLERQTIKFSGVESFIKFCSLIKMHNFYLKEPPTVSKVVEEVVIIENGERTVKYNDISINANVDGLNYSFQELVNQNLKVEPKEVDSKVKTEKLEKENEDLKARLEAIEAKLMSAESSQWTRKLSHGLIRSRNQSKKSEITINQNQPNKFIKEYGIYRRSNKRIRH